MFPRAAVDGIFRSTSWIIRQRAFICRMMRGSQSYGSSEIYSTNFRSQPFCLRCFQNSFKHA